MYPSCNYETLLNLESTKEKENSIKVSVKFFLKLFMSSDILTTTMLLLEESWLNGFWQKKVGVFCQHKNEPLENITWKNIFAPVFKMLITRGWESAMKQFLFRSGLERLPDFFVPRGCVIFFFARRGCMIFFCLKRLYDFFCPERLRDFFCPKRFWKFLSREVAWFFCPEVAWFFLS